MITRRSVTSKCNRVNVGVFSLGKIIARTSFFQLFSARRCNCGNCVFGMEITISKSVNLPVKSYDKTFWKNIHAFYSFE